MGDETVFLSQVLDFQNKDYCNNDFARDDHWFVWDSEERNGTNILKGTNQFVYIKLYGIFETKPSNPQNNLESKLSGS